mgnify:CR=1 FL=1
MNELDIIYTISHTHSDQENKYITRRQMWYTFIIKAQISTDKKGIVIVGLPKCTHWPRCAAALPRYGTLRYGQEMDFIDQNSCK